MSWTHRTHRVTHGRDGWSLAVSDERWVATIAEEVTEKVLAALGHPCCGRGPLARLTITYRTLHRLGWPVDSEIVRCGELGDNALDYFWHKVLNLPNRLYLGERQVLRIPLTEEQAEELDPDFVARWRIPEEPELNDGPISADDAAMFREAASALASKEVRAELEDEVDS